ncbi:MAG: hypothetical protein IPJ12_14375 [Betaproteobacteria bacterium]|nr:hypothetical protein [Betaproteobacteria bacterium]MBK7648303.1 hypothetical protein [Betaproteobacteria bacterium]
MKEIFEIDTDILRDLVNKGYAVDVRDALEKSIFLFEYLERYRQTDGTIIVNDRQHENKHIPIRAFEKINA